MESNIRCLSLELLRRSCLHGGFYTYLEGVQSALWLDHIPSFIFRNGLWCSQSQQPSTISRILFNSLIVPGIATTSSYIWPWCLSRSFRWLLSFVQQLSLTLWFSCSLLGGKLRSFNQSTSTSGQTSWSLADPYICLTLQKTIHPMTVEHKLCRSYSNSYSLSNTSSWCTSAIRTFAKTSQN